MQRSFSKLGLQVGGTVFFWGERGRGGEGCGREKGVKDEGGQANDSNPGLWGNFSLPNTPPPPNHTLQVSQPPVTINTKGLGPYLRSCATRAGNQLRGQETIGTTPRRPQRETLKSESPSFSSTTRGLHNHPLVTDLRGLIPSQQQRVLLQIEPSDAACPCRPL